MKIFGSLSPWLYACLGWVNGDHAEPSVARQMVALEKNADSVQRHTSRIALHNFEYIIFCFMSCFISGKLDLTGSCFDWTAEKSYQANSYPKWRRNQQCPCVEHSRSYNTCRQKNWRSIRFVHYHGLRIVVLECTLLISGIILALEPVISFGDETVCLWTN